MKEFDTEIRLAPDESRYVKVFIRNQGEIYVVKSILEQLDSVRKINDTVVHSGGKETITLTVYPRRTITAEEVEEEVKDCLSSINLESPILNQADKTNTLNSLSCCPEAERLYKQALLKYANSSYERNVLDDMRLCLELFLKTKLGNDKSLENQKPFVGKYQEEKGMSKELRNMFGTVLEYYCVYQNNHVKHNDKINPNEIDFVMKLTIAFIQSFN